MTRISPSARLSIAWNAGQLTPDRLDFVGFYDKPLLKFERLLETYLAFAPAGFTSFLQAMPVWLNQKLHLAREMRRGLKGQYRKRFLFTEHQEAHAASAFLPSPFDEAAILTLDGVGEWATASYGCGQRQSHPADARTAIPSLARSALLGFHVFLRLPRQFRRVQADGPGPLRRTVYKDLILEKIIDLKADGIVSHGHVATSTTVRADA